MNRTTRLALGACMAIAAAAAAQAQTLIDTIGPGDAYVHQMGWAVGNAGDGSDYEAYALFSPSMSGPAGRVDAAFWLVSSDPNAQVTLNIRANDNNGKPGTLLASGIATLPSQGIASALLDTAVQLDAGQQYWFGVATVSPQSAAGWFLSPLGLTTTIAGTGAIWQQSGDWALHQDAMGAFAISAVPNPPQYALLGLGLLTLAAVAKRRASGQR